MITVIITCLALALLTAGVIIYTLSPTGKTRRQQNSQYCTKHVICGPIIPGGPDRVQWVYGPHRTRGNDCDGPLHTRLPGWW